MGAATPHKLPASPGACSGSQPDRRHAGPGQRSHPRRGYGPGTRQSGRRHPGSDLGAAAAKPTAAAKPAAARPMAKPAAAPEPTGKAVLLGRISGSTNDSVAVSLRENPLDPKTSSFGCR